MAMESTLLIVKPDGVRRGLVGEVLRRVEAKGLSIAEMRTMTIDRSLAERHYAEHVEKPFFGELVSFITSGPTLALALEGEGAIAVARTTIGAAKADASEGDVIVVTGSLYTVADARRALAEES